MNIRETKIISLNRNNRYQYWQQIQKNKKVNKNKKEDRKKKDRIP